MEKVTGTGDKKLTPADIAAAVAVEVEKQLVFTAGFPGAIRTPITGGVKPKASTAYTLLDIAGNSYSDTELNKHYQSRNVDNLPGVRLSKTDYATYGYWLGIPPSEDTLTNSYVFGIPHDDRGLEASSLATDDALGNTATYSGNALGLSVLTEPDGRNHKAIKSGEFTADVKLTASFGDNPTVKGTVNNFKGNAVGSDWSVELREAPLLTTDPAAFSDQYYGLTHANGASLKGTWHAEAASVAATQLPKSSGRPNSISGAFRAMFPNGRAVGGYATVKDE